MATAAALVVGVLVGGLMFGGGVAHADDEDVFIATLDHFTVPYASRDNAILQAKTLCMWYSVNERSFFELGVLELLKANPGWSDDDAAHFAGAATAMYCPQYGPDEN